ncbi:MAG: phosphoribosylformylglycinamidine synthase subunit PurL [Planctomycetota bacterium]
MLWEVDIHPAAGRVDREGERLVESARAIGVALTGVATARGFLLESQALAEADARRIAERLLADTVVEHAVVGRVGGEHLSTPPAGNGRLVSVMPKPGVMDPVAQTTEGAVAELGYADVRVGTLRKYWMDGVDASGAESLGRRLLANDAIEQLVVGPLRLERLHAGSPYRFELKTVTILGLDDDGLMRLSREGQLYLQLAEMQTIQRYYADLGREPTDIELETLAQTWSEHCSHKTLAGRIAYRDENGEQRFENMLKETVFAATVELRRRWSEAPDREDWCESVFKDNAGVVRFDETDNVCFKVETHNHPSALEPYGGANTGLGGVLRDTLGTGLGAKPVCSTDVFCFAPPTTPDEDLPAGVLAPRRVMRGVVEGVRDYGNRMGVPTVNGAVCFDDRYLGNPLVYCGNVGIVPRDKTHKEPQPGDLIVAIGGRTGRDGIHGATFSSAELTSESESVSGGAVQIGNAIEEKKVNDVLLQARDRGLYTAVTDCGAGGFSSAVGEMGEEIGAEVELASAPLKYEGLSYTEIWISEAQERMVFSVPERNAEAFRELCEGEGVEVCVIGRFTPTGKLTLKYRGEHVGELPMDFLHNGRPPVVREATYTPASRDPASLTVDDATSDLLAILASPNVASKEWIIRQYDHEVQGGSVVKPLVGVGEGGPSDAAVVRPKLDSRRGIVIACGINPRYGDLDTYRMAASAIDEAIRNCVAVGADPARIALLDNFCWGDCEQADTLGSLVRAALACRDLSLAYEAPFISGKDSLNNEFSFMAEGGEKRSIAIPPTLLISGLGQIADVANAVTMDLKRPGNLLYAVGETHGELGGSHLALVRGAAGGEPPSVDPLVARRSYAALHAAMSGGLVASCHDASEGGLAAALAEMCLAGGLGAAADLSALHDDRVCALFSESNSRFVCEITSAQAEAFEAAMAGVAIQRVGHVNAEPTLTITHGGQPCVRASVASLDAAWRTPLGC